MVETPTTSLLPCPAPVDCPGCDGSGRVGGSTCEACDGGHVAPSPAPAREDGVREWWCYHCGFVTDDDAEARQHFGPGTLWEPACVAAAMYAQADVRREAIGYHDSWRKALARAEAAEAKLAALTAPDDPSPSDTGRAG